MGAFTPDWTTPIQGICWTQECWGHVLHELRYPAGRLGTDSVNGGRRVKKCILKSYPGSDSVLFEREAPGISRF